MIKHTLTIYTHDDNTYTVEEDALSILNLILKEKTVKVGDVEIPFHAIIKVEDRTETVDTPVVEDEFCIPVGGGGSGDCAEVGTAVVDTDVVCDD